MGLEEMKIWENSFPGKIKGKGLEEGTRVEYQQED